MASLVLGCGVMAFSLASPRLPPTTISLDPTVVRARELSALLAATGQNCLQFPQLLTVGSHGHGHGGGGDGDDDDGRRSVVMRPVRPSRLRLALRHSTVVVSVHIRGDIPGQDYMSTEQELGYTDADDDDEADATPWLSSLFHQDHRRMKRSLVAFGRATSDRSLTASIHDLAVAPSLQRRGLGRQVLHRLVRELMRRGIYDIAALTTPEQRQFFVACGFSEDVLQSTTMLYTRSPLAAADASTKKMFERKCLLIPPALKPRHVSFAEQLMTEESTVQVKSLG